MINLKNSILQFVAKQIKETATLAAGATSFWGAYQPKEPKNLTK
jgi:cyclic lactone autoinducer peptide